jgi:hypothetical protein
MMHDPEYKAWVYNWCWKNVIEDELEPGKPYHKSHYEGKWHMVDVYTIHFKTKHFRGFYLNKDGKKDTSEFSIGKQGILLPFTGQPDKNKRKIFAGDVVQFYTRTRGVDGPGLIREVVWDPAGRWLPFLCDTFIQDELGDWFEFDEATRFEVIGNVYENPELKKKIADQDAIYEKERRF